MLSFTPVSGKKKEREGKNVRGSREVAAMLSPSYGFSQLLAHPA